ncbi:MAG: MFS transporter, partial [Bacteroidota bacterium]
EKMVDKVYMVIDQITNKTSDLKEGVISKLRNYMNSLDRPELQYEGVAHDVEKLFHDPKAGAEALANRVKSMDRDTIKAIIATRQDISDEDAERIVSKIESARDSFLMKIDQMKHEIERRVDMVKQETVHQADEVRKTASTAAWWAFGTAVISGIAAAIGGMVAV